MNVKLKLYTQRRDLNFKDKMFYLLDLSPCDEMVDIPVLGTGASRRVGSSPTEGKNILFFTQTFL